MILCSVRRLDSRQTSTSRAVNWALRTKARSRLVSGINHFANTASGRPLLARRRVASPIHGRWPRCIRANNAENIYVQSSDTALAGAPWTTCSTSPHPCSLSCLGAVCLSSRHLYDKLLCCSPLRFVQRIGSSEFFLARFPHRPYSRAQQISKSCSYV